MIFLVFKSKNPLLLCKAYTVFVRSILEYGTVVYSPCYVQDIVTLEHVQLYFLKKLCFRCKVRFTSYERLCVQFQLEPLSFRRDVNDLCFLYNLHAKSSNLSIPNIFESKNSRTRGLPIKLSPLFRLHSNIQKHFFTHRVITNWNSLNPGLLSLSNVDSFRNNVKKFVKVDYIL